MIVDLDQFCDPDFQRLCWVQKPFVLGKWRYATDGRVLIREPKTLPAGATRANGTKPKESVILPFFKGFNPKQCTEPLPAYDGSTTDQLCPSCDGTYRAQEVCPKCDGYGRIAAKKHCRSCKGSGERSTKTPCLDCIDGKKLKSVAFSDYSLAARIVRLLNQLPEVRYRPGSHRTRQDSAIEMIDADGRQILAMSSVRENR